MLVIECLDRDPDDPETTADPTSSPSEPTPVRVVLTPARARAFARRAQSVVSAGRPPCPFCGGPLGARGPHLPARERLQALTPVPSGEAAGLPRRPRRGDDLVVGRIADASNLALLVRRRREPGRSPSTSRSRGSARCGTSPTERLPAVRSRAYLLSAVGGWDVVPETVLRDGPLRAGVRAAVGRRPDWSSRSTRVDLVAPDAVARRVAARAAR